MRAARGGRGRPERRGLYTFPAICDRAFSSFTRGDLRVLRRAFRLARRPVRTVLEPACGTGRLLEPLARRGFRVLGFDEAPEMVAWARRRLAAWRGRVVRLRMEAFRPAAFRADAAFLLHATICHLPRERDALAHLDRMARVLRPGGIYAVGIWTVGMKPLRAGGEAIGTWEAPGDPAPWRLSLRVSRRDLRRRREAVDVRLAVRGRGGVRWYADRYWLRTYTTAQWERLLGKVEGLRAVEVLGVEGGRPARPVDGGEFVYVLRRA